VKQEPFSIKLRFIKEKIFVVRLLANGGNVGNFVAARGHFDVADAGVERRPGIPLPFWVVTVGVGQVDDG